MTISIAKRTLDIPADASTAEKLALLARLKRSIVGSQSVKAAAIKAGAVQPLLDLLAIDTTSLPGDDAAQPVSLRTEAANVLASLSIPNLGAVSSLLELGAYDKLAQSFATAVITATSDHYSPAAGKLVDAHLRALKCLYGDLVKVVGPREWGTDVIGASVDVVERRDSENLWTLAAAEQTKESDSKGKGKGREDDPVIARKGVFDQDDLSRLQNEADRVLLAFFGRAKDQHVAGPSVPTASTGDAATYERSTTLSLLLEQVLIPLASPDGLLSIVESDRIRSLDHACSFLTAVIRSPVQRGLVLAGTSGARTMAALQHLVAHGPEKVQESALRAMTVLARDSRDATLTLLNMDGTERLGGRLQPYASLIQSSSPAVRLAAASLCSILLKQLDRYAGVPKRDIELGAAIGSTLLSLVEHESALRARAAFTFAYHVADDADMQQRAMAAQCLGIFKPLLAHTLTPDNPYPTPAALEEHGRAREGLLLALAALCATSEPNRRAVLDAQLLPPILDSFTHPLVGVRAAACHCIRALSRSVSVLRTDMVESEAQALLVWLLREDENEVVKVTATAAVANLLLEFSPLRQALVEAGCVQRMCQLIVKSPNEALRLNAMWAIKNGEFIDRATYQSSADFKRTVLQNLTWDNLAALISSPSCATAEVALGILRNITCVTNNEAITGLREDELGEDRLLALLEAQITGSSMGPHPTAGARLSHGSGSSGHPARWSEQCAVEALYCLNNIATAHEAAQLAIASRTSTLRYLLLYLDRGSLPLRVASLWVLHNLVYRRTGLPPPSVSGHGYGHAHGHRSSRRGGPHEVVDKLRAMGLEGKLRTLERDPELDVRERVRDLTEALAVA